MAEDNNFIYKDRDKDFLPFSRGKRGAVGLEKRQGQRIGY